MRDYPPAHAWRLPIGANPVPGGTHFRVWAADARDVAVALFEGDRIVATHTLAPEGNGYFRATVPGVEPGARYMYSVDGSDPRPDPAARFQPESVHGPSQVVDPAFAWDDAAWRGLPMEDLVIYEVHVGAATPEGTFDALVGRLDDLVVAGVTAIELMPVADFPGERGWGYDGVSLFAPARAYGGPEGLKRLVDAAHARGLAVLLDVVYNHLGPDGNYLRQFSRAYFTDRYTTPWGDALNFDGPGSRPVRDFFIANACYWVHEYHIDGLRLDATHAITDSSRPHILAELASELRASLPPERQVVIIAESHRNDPTLLRSPEEGGYGLDGVWADDLHHQIRVATAGDRDGYYIDFRGSAADMATTLRQGWFYTGQYSAYLEDPRGAPPGDLPYPAFVHCIQNHDQVGNRAFGDRLHHQIGLDAYRAVSALLLLDPGTPLLFMGQEWAASSPFQYFTDHHPELGRLVTEGRRREFARFTAFTDEEIPDPQALTTFLHSKLRWEERDEPVHAGTLRLYHDLLDLRRSHPALRERSRESVGVAALGESVLALRRTAAPGQTLLLLVQLGSAPAQLVLEGAAITRPPEGCRWSLLLDTEAEQYRGAGAAPRDIANGSVQSLELATPRAIILQAEVGPPLPPDLAPHEEEQSRPVPAPKVDSLVQEVLAQPRIPRASYRFQFSPGFTFADALALVPYLDALGISDVYASPIFTPRPGSTHGYDVVDHNSINPALGGEAGFAGLAAALRDRRMGLILDVVPNHMGINSEANTWWMDVLENGPSSLYASAFDIEWRPVKPELADKVLLPILEDQYGRVLEEGKLRLVYEDGAFFIFYYDTRLPLAPRTYSQILSYPLEALLAALGPEHEHTLEYQSILTAINYLPPRTEGDPAKLVERNREKEIIKRRIAVLAAASPEVRAAIDEAVQVINGRVGDPQSFDRLDALLDDQAYRPAFWRVAAEEINYRRFFDINDLAAIRTEDPAILQATHRLVFRLLGEGSVTGLRLDHVDGLYDPTGYLRRLQEEYVFHRVRARLAQSEPALPDDETLAAQVAALLDPWFAAQAETERAGPAPWPLYVVAEKILGEGESLPRDWAVAGTTGYDFLNAVNGLFVDTRNAGPFDALYQAFAGPIQPFHQMIDTTRKMTMLVSMASEIYTLSHRLERIAEKYRRYRDFTLDTLTFALREVIAALPIYRTYITDPTTVTTRDRQFVAAAAATAKRRNPRTAAAVFDFIRDTLLLSNLDYFSAEDQQQIRQWVGKFQQLTGPVMAKGVEDTAFYVYNRLVSLNEVGGHPDLFGGSVPAFHARNAANQRSWPHTMLTSSTHDTKRSEDVRARINVLSELPDVWEEALGRWRERNAPHKTEVDGALAPSPNDEYFFYQALLGAWPYQDGARGAAAGGLLLAPSTVHGPPSEQWLTFRDRLVAYMQKATKEAKVHTSWINPDQTYDEAMREFVCRVMDTEHSGAFLADARALAEQVACYGQVNSLAQTLLKLTAPGVPDIYQGCELWDLSLVDPDNRRPVDYALRQRLLAELREHAAAGDDLRRLVRELLDTSADGRIKLYLTNRALELRAAHPELFAHGDYLPLAAVGARREHVCAFARTHGGSHAITVAPRLVAGLAGGALAAPLGGAVWGDTWLALPTEMAGRRYHHWLTGEILPVQIFEGQPGLPLAAICAHLPLALLVLLDDR